MDRLGGSWASWHEAATGGGGGTAKWKRQQQDAAAAELARERDALRATQRELEAMRAELSLKQAELDEVTGMLISSKIASAEQSEALLFTTHDLRQVELRFEQMSEIPMAEHPADAKKRSKAVSRRESFPAAVGKGRKM